MTLKRDTKNSLSQNKWRDKQASVLALYNNFSSIPLHPIQKQKTKKALNNKSQREMCEFEVF